MSSIVILKIWYSDSKGNITIAKKTTHAGLQKNCIIDTEEYAIKVGNNISVTMLPLHVLRNKKKWKREKDPHLFLGLESLKNYKDNQGTSRQWKMKMD